MTITDVIQKAYVAYYGRPADPNGLNHWKNQVENAGEDLSAVISAFGASAEFTDRFGEQEPNALVNNVYQFLFDRDADQGGLDFYVNRLQTSGSTLVNIALDILNGARNTDGGSQDESIINNKMNMANVFTSLVEVSGVEYGADQINMAKSVLDGVNENPDSVTAGISKAVTTVQSFPQGEEINFVVGTPGNDTLDATLRNDVFSGLEGQDIFRFDTNDSIELLMDKITDFEATNNGDQIVFSSIVGVAAADSIAPTDVKSAVSEGDGNESIFATVTNGVVALSGSDVNTIDTLAEWFNVTKSTQLVPFDHVVAFAFDGNTYIVQNKTTNPNIIELNGVTDISSVSAAATGVDTIFIG